MTGTPDSPQALFSAATAAHQAGRLDQAAALYRRILAKNRRYPDVLHQLGLIEHLHGNGAVAIGLIREAVALDARQPVYFNNLASALIDAGDFAGARSEAERAIALSPGYAQAWINLATALLRGGDLVSAAGAFHRAVQLAPDNAIAHYWLGRTLQSQQRFADAAASYTKVTELAPDFADGHCNLGFALLMAGWPEDGARACRKAIALSPGYADAHNNLGYILQVTGDIAGARASYEAAVAHDPNHAAAFNNIGNLEKDLGNTDAALAAYRKALAIQPDFARALFNITDLKTFSTRDDDFAAISAQLAGPGASSAQAHYLHFAKAKALEDLGEVDEAFKHYEAGNASKRKSTPYDEAFILGYLGDMARYYDRQTLQRLQGGGIASPAPIFIVGMPRSGTTLVEQILASHPRVFGGGERTDLDAAIAAALPEGKAEIRARALTPAHIRALGEQYLARLPALTGGHTHVTDKMPANFMHLGLIHMALPQARIIHVMRDAADTCVSCYFKLFETGQEFTYDMAELARFYIGYRKLMDHWRSVAPGIIYDIAYERLVGNTEGETRRMLEYCGLEWNPACLSFYKTARAVQTASATQVRKPMYSSAIGRWKRYERHIGPLLTALAAR